MYSLSKPAFLINRYWLQFIFVAGLYFLTGRLGLMFSADNGYSTLIWPPSGIALASVILFGYRIWPALLLGAFATNLSLGPSYATLYEAVISQPQNIVIAIGNTSQALIATWLLQKFNCYSTQLTKLSSITKFYLIAGPLACLTAASVGTTSLYIFNIISYESIINSWSIWWVGDVNGVILITPFLIIWNQPHISTKSDRRISVTIGLLLIFCTIAVLVRQLQSWNQDDIEDQLRYDAALSVNILEDNLADALRASRSLASYIESSIDVTEDEFIKFTSQGLSLNENIAAISWNPMISFHDRPRVNALLKSSAPNPKAKEFGIWQIDKATEAPIPASSSDNHVYVKYISPLETNRSVIGLDVWLEPIRRAALEYAIMNAAPAVTDRIDLVQEKEKSAGVLLFTPVYNKKTVEGFATSVLRIPSLMAQLKGIAHQDDLHFSLYDLSRPAEDHTLFSNGATVSAQWANTTQKIILPFANKQWLLKIAPTDRYIRSLSDKSSWLAIGVTWTTAAALAILLLVMAGNQHETDRQVRERTEELILATQAKSDFLANMSHEIRTPLNGVMGTLELLKEEGLNEKQRKLLQITSQSAQTLLTIINDVLDFSKLEDGKLNLQYIPTNIKEIISATHALLKSTSAVKGLNFTIQYACDYDGNVMLDGARLQQVLYNIVGNAIKFTEHGSVALSLQTKLEKDGTVSVQIMVTDTGIGISQNDQVHIFDRFNQVEASASRRYQGTGLGLAIAKEIVTLLGGTITLESTLDTGTQVTISELVP